ncbi:MAG: DUF5317 domain-containing protein [Candidatus Bipolaricaulis sp.]|nr:DUF5317 domain-containing protein [Candidatus Bipolaricaulis sp.]MDD5220559.1 DUF5317 domain-containing protein [Candidatus Bipolaricaulis sp.]MDD5646776.1 DUF5317 domain-containing protein [Candidatus Bipolaricaulis sp.]
MIFLYALGVGILLGYVAHGRLRQLTSLSFRVLWLIPLALVIQLLIFPLFSERPLIAFATPVLHVVSYAILFLWLLLNRSIRPVWMIGIGALLNAGVVLANGGYMPSSATALGQAGLGSTAATLLVDGTYGNVVLMGTDSRLNALGDWLFLPSWIPGATAFSIGDLLIMVGLAWLVVKGMRGNG